MADETWRRRLPVGAEVQARGGVHFRVWAPARRRVEVAVEGLEAVALVPDGNSDGGYFEGYVSEASAGMRYRFRLDGEGAFPDPASRFQPEGPHGPSAIVDPAAYRWSDGTWRGIPNKGRVLYEMHIGTFTREGTFRAASEQLPRLAALGVTVLEVMPVADFPGLFGWGYDGVNLYAPTRLYGAPDDFRHFVDLAHTLGLGVILDVVYNHIGPAGNYLGEYSKWYFSCRHQNEWGEALNFDGENAGPVREFFIENAGYWIDEYHLDGLRLDATQAIHDGSSEHVIAALAARARRAAGERSLYLVAENEPQHTNLVRKPRASSEAGGGEQARCGLDALWNDDFHHSAVVAVTGEREAYYSDHRGTPQELLSATRWGYLFQGQRYAWQNDRRGAAGLDLPASAFVHFVENHDQVANSGRGSRLHQKTTRGRFRALTTLLLLGPSTPMLFQGEEFASSAPFLFFADHDAPLLAQVAKGRADFLRQFPSLSTEEMQASLAAPADRRTFERCKLDRAEAASSDHAWAVALHQDLLRLRRETAAFAAEDRTNVHGAVLAHEAHLLRFFHAEGDRLLLVNLGMDLRLTSIADPLVAPPSGMRWGVSLATEGLRYGGEGHPPPEADDGWFLRAHSAVVLAPEPIGDVDPLELPRKGATV